MARLPDLSQLSVQDVGGRIRDDDGKFTAEWQQYLGNPSVQKSQYETDLYALRHSYFNHMNPKVGVASSTPNGTSRGIGLFACEAMAPGEVVGFFTGVWSCESDVDATLGPKDVCVSNYAAAHDLVLPFQFDRVKTWRGEERYTCRTSRREGSSRLEPSGTKPTPTVDRLVVIPRMSSENSPEAAQGRCSLRFSPPEICDVGGLMNHDSGPRATCELVACYVKTARTFEEDEFIEVEVGDPLRPTKVQRGTVGRAALAFRIRQTRSGEHVKAGTELTFDYGRDIGAILAKKDEDAYQGRMEFDDRRGHAYNMYDVQQGIINGADVANQIKRLRGLVDIPSSFCGPPIYPIRCGEGGKVGDLVTLVAAQTSSATWREGLRPLVMRGISTEQTNERLRLFGERLQRAAGFLEDRESTDRLVDEEPVEEDVEEDLEEDAEEEGAEEAREIVQQMYDALEEQSYTERLAARVMPYVSIDWTATFADVARRLNDLSADARSTGAKQRASDAKRTKSQ